MPLITLGTAEIMAIIAAEEAAAAAAVVAAEAAAAEAASQAAAQAAAEQAAQEAARQSAQQGIMQAGAGADVNAGLSQGIVGATPPSPGAPLPPATPLPPAGATPAGPLPSAGQSAGIDFANAKPIEPYKPLPNYGQGTQYASINGPATDITAKGGINLTPEMKLNEDILRQSTMGDGTLTDSLRPTEINKLSTMEPEGGVNLGGGAFSNSIMPPNPPPVQPPSTFMNAFSEAGKFAKANPYPTGLAVYGGLYASGALNQKGDAPPPKRTYNNPYTFSPNFQGSSPDPSMYQSKTNYPTYAMGGITDIPPQTNFANPSQSMMGTSQYDMPTDPMSGNIAQRMAEGGVTGGGQMQLNVPISIGGEGGSGPYTGFGGGGFGGGGGGYAPPGGPQGGSAGSLASLGRGAQQMQPPGATPQAAQGAQMNMQENTQAQSAPNDVNGFTPIQTNQGTLLAGQFLQGLSGLPDQQEYSKAMGSMQQKIQAANARAANRYMGPEYANPIGMARGGITDVPRYKRGGDMDIYDASLRFANMLDNPSRYTPPDTRFQSVDTFRDTNPNTSTKSPDEAAEIRRKAIEQRSYVNTGAKYLPPSRRPGQLDLGPVGGERGKYDNQESILAAQGGIMGYNLGGYANGGNPRLLRGPGDGMSDNIPATISDRQPARLADGEFVVPADVVSHLGNGSTEAGAKKLHEMMNSVRQARTGNPKQGKKINPNKFMPKK